MKKIGIAQIKQESNSFNPMLTVRADFERYGVAAGAGVIERFGRVDEIGGFLSGLGGLPEPAEPVGILRAQAWPGGPLSADARQWLVGCLTDELKRAGPLDGLLFSLHGALVAEDREDVDGELLAAARNILGTRTPIAASVDLHAYCTPEMFGGADVIVAYHTSPHLDIVETGKRTAGALAKLLGGASPAAEHVRLPMITVSEAQNTSGEALAPVWQRLAELEARDDVLSAAVLMTQGWLDVARLGWSVLVVTDGAPAAAKEAALELADSVWSRRRQTRVEMYTARESVDRAMACSGRPVVVADGADATNSGAPGDSTHLLGELMKREIPGGALSIMVDPRAVLNARNAGAGGYFDADVGGKRDNVFSRPLRVRGVVLRLGPARYVLSGHGGSNLAVDMGASATVRAGDVTILFVEHPGPGSTPLMYRCAGLEPADFKIVVVKSPAGFRAEFEPLAAGIVLSDCPGCASPHYGKLPYQRISRPLWPLDDIDDWRNVAWTTQI